MTVPVRLGDLIDTRKGFAFKSSWFKKEGDVAVVKVTNFTSNSIDNTNLIKVTNEIAAKYQSYRLSKGDIVVQTVGSWASNPNSVVGKCIRVPDAVDGSLLNQNAVIIKPKSTIDRTYLYYLLKNDEFKNYIVGTAQGAASQAAITLDSLKAYEFKLPSFSAQQQIAVVLEPYDALIENNLKRIRKLESLAKLLYQHYFEIKAASNWEESRLSDLIVVHRGRSYKSSELSDSDGLPFVNLKCINRNGGFRKNGLKKYTGTYKLTQQVQKGDLVMAVTDMTQERMIVARVARVPSLEGGHGVVSMDIVKLESINGFPRDYLYSMLRWSGFGNEVKNYANGANVLHLLPDRITEYKFNVPPKEIRDEFVQKVSPMFDLIDVLQQKNESLARARDLLLPRLLSGKQAI